MSLNETGTASVALDETWRQLAPIVDEAMKKKADAARDPDLLNDSWNVALIRWASVFEREIAAVQKVYEAAKGGARLSPDDVRAATQVAHKLLHIIGQAGDRVGGGGEENRVRHTWTVQAETGHTETAHTETA
jgi:hypothetical protein